MTDGHFCLFFKRDSLRDTFGSTNLDFFFFFFLRFGILLRDGCCRVARIMSDENGSCDDHVPNHVVSLPSATGSSWQRVFAPLDPCLGEHTTVRCLRVNGTN